MPAPVDTPLREIQQALSRTPMSQPQLRAVLATTCARWELERNNESEAMRHLGLALQMVPDLRPAMRLLYRIYLARGDVRSSVMYLDQEIRATRHPREAAALYRERGQLVEAHFHDLSAAQQCYQAALKATPRDLAVLRSVERVSLARGDLFWLIANLESQLEVLQDPGAVAGVLRELALLEARHHGDVALGNDMLLAALELFPGHLGLLADLFRMAEIAGDVELMLHALEMEAENRPPEQRAMPLARASASLREQRDRVAAVLLMQAAARAQPHNFSLWRSLEELSLATSRYDTALEACLGQLKAVRDEDDPGVRAELHYRIGKLALFRMGRVPEGLAAMRKALHLFPAHVPALEDTGRFLIANEMWAQLLELLKLQIVTAKQAGLTAEEVALAHLRAGQVMEEHLGEPEGARQHYESAIRAHGGFRPARDRLERVLHQLARMDDLREYYRLELERSNEPARKVFLLSVLGQLHARHEDPSEAIKYLVSVLREVPEHLPSLQLLARLLSRANRPKDLLRITEQEVKLTVSPVRKAKLLHRAGELALQLGDRLKARRCFETGLDAVDDHRPSMESLELLLRQSGDHGALLQLLRKRLLYANDRSRQVSLRLEIANLLATRMGRPHDALAEIQQLLARWPRHLPALHAAEGLAARIGDHRALLAVLEQHIATVAGPRTRALLLHRAANVRSRALGDHEGAIRDLVRALELWPQLGVARAHLLRIYEHLGRSRELQSFAEAGLTSERGTDDRRAMALQLAELTPRPVVAIQYLAAVAEARPEDYVTQLRLARACRAARRPSREAGALAAAADRIALDLEASDLDVLSLRYRSARAEESAGNLDAADAGYARILDVHPGHLLAQRGRLRIKERKRESVLVRSADDLIRAADDAQSAAERAAYLTIAAELHERRRDLTRAVTTADAAVEACPAYIPAHHLRARVLERLGQPEHVEQAIATLERLAERLHGASSRAVALCRAGTLALRTVEEDRPNERAWRLFSRALELDPGCDPAFRGLQRTLQHHGSTGAGKLAKILERRLDHLLATAELTASPLRDLSRLGRDAVGAECAAALLERGIDVAPTDSGLRAELAQAYARLDRWHDAVRELELAIANELSPERQAALRYFAGEAHEHTGNGRAAAAHLVAAGRGGYHPRHALLRAERVARDAGNTELRVEALQLLVDLGEGPERIRSLRALATLHRRELRQPDVAVELMRELLLLRPTDIAVLNELRRLLEDLGRSEESSAALLASVAHHRAWLRTQGLQAEHGLAPVVGLLQLFDSMRDVDGVYLAAAILEVIAPAKLPPGRACDALVSEPWPLPQPQEGRPFDLLVGDLPSSATLDLLREGVGYLPEIPGAPTPAIDISPRNSLPPTSAAAMVVRALANAMGAPVPLVFVNQRSESSVTAHVGTIPCVVIGRRINAAPFAPGARDRIGRALLRLTTGGDHLHRTATDEQVLGVIIGLCRASGLDIPPVVTHDARVAEAIRTSLNAIDVPSDLREAARRVADSIETLDVRLVRDALQMAEDRAGAVCAADPRATLKLLLDDNALESPRATAFAGYLLSDDHLSLRRTLGYQAEIELTEADVEEVPA